MTENYYVYERSAGYRGGGLSFGGYDFYCPSGNTFSFSAQCDKSAAAYARQMVENSAGRLAGGTFEEADALAAQMQEKNPRAVYMIACIVTY